MIKKAIAKIYPIKDIGPIKTWLGMDISIGTNSIEISQKNYAEKILMRFGYQHAKPKATPMKKDLIL